MSKTKFVHLQIPSACNENWNSMTPQAGGRHCHTCQKTVVDFTTMSDSEIFRFFERNRGTVCGRLFPHQLERDIIGPPKTNLLFRYILPATLPLMLLHSAAEAQLPDTSTPLEQAPVRGRVISSIVTPDKLTVKGRILDKNGAPVPGASIFIKDSRMGTVSNDQGCFMLSVQQLPVSIAVTSVGFLTKEMEVTSQDTTVTLNLQETVMGGIMGVVVKTKRKKTKNQSPPATKQTVLKESPRLLLYPNPVTSGSIVHVKTSNTERGEYEIRLFNFAGQLIQSSKVNLKGGNEESGIQLKGVPAGNYLLQLTSKKRSVELSQQLVIE